MLACGAGRCEPLPRAVGEARRFALAARTTSWAFATDCEVHLCRGRQCRPVPALEAGSDGWIGALAFMPDGEVLITATSDGRVQFFSGTDGRALTPPLNQHSGAVTRIVFDGAGSLMATGGRDGTVQLWDAVARRPIGVPLPQPTASQVSDLALATAGDRLAVLYSDGGVDLLELDPDVLLRRACAIANRTLTLGEWQSLGGSGTCPAVCAGAGARCIGSPVGVGVPR